MIGQADDGVRLKIENRTEPPRTAARCPRCGGRCQAEQVLGPGDTINNFYHWSCWACGWEGQDFRFPEDASDFNAVVKRGMTLRQQRVEAGEITLEEQVEDLASRAVDTPARTRLRLFLEDALREARHR